MKRICSLLLTLALILGLAACGQKAPTWQEQYDLGVKYLSEGNYEEAVIAFTAAIEIDPKKPEAYIGLADVYTAQGDTDSARKALEDGLAATGDSALQTRLDALNAEETASPEALQGGAPDGASETVTVEGYVIDNSVEYEEQLGLYLEQYPNAVSMDTYGIRFLHPVEGSMEGQPVTVSEAGICDDGRPELYDPNMLGRPLLVTGYFFRNEQTEELKGPFERDGETSYHYRPNGDYCFNVTGYEEIG